MKNKPTDLREAFTLYDLRGEWANTHDKEIILRQINKKVRKDYLPKSSIKKVLKEGQGGGNWRRLLIQLLDE